ncbi:hypothetical protein K0A97_02950 [Patescibacteria group bacterium]|nr:hypothetical protein [Patescibacteria group bacterium]
MKKPQNTILLLLILAITLSVVSIVLNLTLVTSLKEIRIYDDSFSASSSTKISGEVGIHILPSNRSPE